MKREDNKKKGERKLSNKYPHKTRAPGSEVKSKLRSFDVRPSKTKGQNFLISDAVINSIVSFAAIQGDERVVEIGPGLGALTQHLAKAKDLTLVEIEAQFCADLKERYPHAKIIHGDVCSVDLSKLSTPDVPLTVFGNLPYVYSTDIVFHLLAHAGAIGRAVLMLQREFVERLAAGPGGRDYGRTSVACQMRCDVRAGPVIEGTSFHPPTKVQSQLVELTFLPALRIPIDDYDWFVKVVKGAFHMRRKKLPNSLIGSGLLKKDNAFAACEHAGIDVMRRAETLSMQEFVTLANSIRLITGQPLA